MTDFPPVGVGDRQPTKAADENQDAQPDLRTICIAFPTIMSGLVLRWYADQAAWEADDQLANAGREETRFFCEPSEEFRAEVQASHEYIKAAHGFGYRSQPLDVSRWVTHRSVRLFGNEIAPVGAAE